MGTTASTTEDEWLELSNDGNESVDLENWTLTAQDGTPNIIFFGVNLKNKTIPADGYFCWKEQTTKHCHLLLPT